MIFAAAVFVWGERPLQRPLAPNPPKFRDLIPSSEQKEIAENLLRTLVIHLENSAVPLEAGAPESLRQFVTRLKMLPNQTQDALMRAARAFAAKDDQTKKSFFGPYYAPTPKTRLGKIPTLLQVMKKRFRPIRPPVITQGSPLETYSYGADSPMESSEKKFLSPMRTVLRLESIRVDRMNDDDTPTDEIYLGVVTGGLGPFTVTRIPAGDTWWEIGKGQTKLLNIQLSRFNERRDDTEVFALVNVFEYDDGTWGKIWGSLVELGEFAFKQWLASEIGYIAAEIVMSFLEDFFDWLGGLFTNEDDFIGTIGMATTINGLKKYFSAPGLHLKYVEGEDARYAFNIYWDHHVPIIK